MIKSLWQTSYIAIIPMLIGSIIFTLIPPFKWNHELFHVLLEGGGSLVSFILALFISSLIVKERLEMNYIWLIACFIAMGILDLAHSQFPPGQTFVWLHSCATLIGGFFAALIWLPVSTSKKFFTKWFVFSIIILSISFSVASILLPETTVAMLDKNKEFTWSAKALNLIGGLGFIIAWGYFYKMYHSIHLDESMFFSNHFFLFGLAAILFEFSVLWDGNWWLWHMLRAFAFLILAIHFARIYWEDVANLIQTNHQLNDAQAHLKKITDEAIAASKAKSEFLANMSHELRTPMHGILSFSRFGINNVEQGDLPKLAKYFDRINISGERLLTLIDDLLDLSKLEAGKMEFEFKELIWMKL